MITPQRLWMSGNSLAISVPKKIAKLYGYKVGDYIEITWKSPIEGLGIDELKLPELNDLGEENARN